MGGGENTAVSALVIGHPRRHLPGLNEDVTFVRSTDPASARKFVVRADGRLQRVATLRAEEDRARVARYGALTPGFHDALERVAPSSAEPVAIYFDPGVHWDSLTPRLNARDLLTRVQARNELRDAIHTRGRALTTQLASVGVTEVSAGEAMPALFTVATPPVIRAIGRWPGVRLVTSNRTGRIVRHSAPNVTSDPEIDTSFNDLGYYGEGQRIGLVESAQCGIYSEHDRFYYLGAFSNEGVNYQMPPITCTTDSQCSVCGAGACVAESYGSERHCIDRHMTAVASVVAATHIIGSSKVPWSAAKATLYIPTEGHQAPGESYPAIGCSPQGTLDAYSWLDQSSTHVTTVNESYGCEPINQNATSFDGDGITQDWFARYRGMSITRCAGNDPTDPACSYSLNSICVGGFEELQDGRLHWDGSYLNPTDTDREEPDLVARSVDLAVAAVGDPDGLWPDPDDDGTSYAAPAAAAVAALLKEACGGDLDPRTVRAILRTSAWHRNVTGSAYSTPTEAVDHHDGAGALYAPGALAFCHPNGSSGIETNHHADEFDLTASQELPEHVTDEPIDTMQSLASSGDFTSFGFEPMNAFEGQSLMNLDLNEGDRVRFTFTWDSCPTGNTGVAPATPAVDFDVALCNETRCIARSASFDDNVEGFDVKVQVGEGGTWTIYAYHPPMATACGGGSHEPFSWAVAWGSY